MILFLIPGKEMWMCNPFLMTLTVFKLLLPTKYCKAYLVSV